MVLSFWLLLFPNMCMGWADSWEGLRSAFGNLDSISADFIQEKHLPILARPVVSTGTLHYRHPDSLRWEYVTPAKSVFLVHDGKMERFVQSGDSYAKENGSSLDFMVFVQQEICNWLTGSFGDSSLFDAKLTKGAKVVLTPKDIGFSQMVRQIEVSLSDRPGVIDSVVIYEGDNSFTKLAFNHTRLNQPIANTVFEKVQ